MKNCRMKLISIILLAIPFISITSLQAADKGSKENAAALSWLAAVDRSEITSSTIALKKKPDGEVKKFAELMIKDHSKNLKETKQLQKKFHDQNMMSANIKDLNKESAKQFHALKTTKTNEIDKQYMEMMKKDHSQALATIDQYISTVNNSEIESHLKNTREHIAHHLEEANNILNTL